MRALSIAGSPEIVPRSAWNADESIRRAPPAYAPAVRFAVVHHTAGASDYGPEESAAIVRAIELYHVKGNGWKDVGYNFLVDRYGRVFEGRYGGIDRNVVGAHAQGFNLGSVGVALIGSYDSGTPPPEALAALVRLLSWRLDVAHVDPLSTLSWLSGGNGRFPAGLPVFLRAVSGHRDAGFTDCPGDALYRELDGLAARVAATGLPKLYDPDASGALGGEIRFGARLSAPLSWRVTVRNGDGRAVATGAGRGDTVAWTWDSTGAAPDVYSYAVEGGPGVRAATGSLGVRAPALALANVAAEPGTVTPDGDGVDDVATVAYALSAPALVTVRLLNEAGSPVETLFEERREAGRRSFIVVPGSLSDGFYRIEIAAREPVGGGAAAAYAPLVVDHAPVGFRVDPPAFSPNGDGRLETATFSFALAAEADVRLEVVNPDDEVEEVFAGLLAPGVQHVTWDGTLPGGLARDGLYRAVLTIGPGESVSRHVVLFTVDTTPPALELLSLPDLEFRLSEPATVVLELDGVQVARAAPAGVFRVPYAGVPARVRAVAWDAAGNESAPVRVF